MWLAPHQIKILPIADRHIEYAKELQAALKKAKIRVDVDDRAEKVGYKIREAKLEKIPYIIVVGDREVEEQRVNINERGVEEKQDMSKDEFIARMIEEAKVPSDR